MRCAPICVLLVAALPLLSVAGTRPSFSDLTIVLDFKGPRSDISVTEMKKETQGILRDSGLRLDWRAVDQAYSESYNDLVVVRFKGSCVAEPIPYVPDELGPLAFTYTTEGTVQPFSEVACDKVVRSVRSAMWGADFKKAEQLLGRALGRVVAHELVHILTGSGEHGPSGVERPALSGRQLIAASLALDPADLARLREKQKTH